MNYVMGFLSSTLFAEYMLFNENQSENHLELLQRL